jgi:hypothetical protein
VNDVPLAKTGIAAGQNGRRRLKHGQIMTSATPFVDPLTKKEADRSKRLETESPTGVVPRWD